MQGGGSALPGWEQAIDPNSGAKLARFLLVALRGLRVVGGFKGGVGFRGLGLEGLGCSVEGLEFRGLGF